MASSNEGEKRTTKKSLLIDLTSTSDDIEKSFVPEKTTVIYHRAEASPFPKNSSQKGRLWTPGRFEYYASSW